MSFGFLEAHPRGLNLQIWKRRWSLTAINSYIAATADLSNWTGLKIPINYVEQKSGCVAE